LSSMHLGQTRSKITELVNKGLEMFFDQLRSHEMGPSHGPSPEAYVRIIVSRGRGKIGFHEKNIEGGTELCLIIQPFLPLDDAAFEKGTSLGIAKRPRNPSISLDPALKSGNYLNSVLAFLETVPKSSKECHLNPERDFAAQWPMPPEDALLCDLDGFLTEGTTFNFFYAKRGILVTSPLDVGILEGITRKNLIALARTHGLPVREARFKPSDLLGADEAFVASTLKEAYPILCVNGQVIGTGKPGPITRKLKTLFHAAALATLK